MDNVFGSRIRELRLRKGYSGAFVARKLGIARSTYANYESGRREPSIEQINHLSEILDTTVDYLTGKNESSSNISSSLSNVVKFLGYGKEITPEQEKTIANLIKAYLDSHKS